MCSSDLTNSEYWFGDWSWLENSEYPKVPKDAKPLFCKKGAHYIGYVIKENGTHKLITKEGNEIVGRNLQQVLDD